MALVDVPIGTPVFRNISEEQLVDGSWRLFDGYLNEKGKAVKRPGLGYIINLHTSLGDETPVLGLHYWKKVNRVIAVIGSNIYAFILGKNGEISLYVLAASVFSARQKTTFAEDNERLFISMGGQVVYINAGYFLGTTAIIAGIVDDVDAPADVSHVAYLDSYLLANSVGTNEFQHSLVANTLSWSASDYFSGAGAPDDIVALFVLNREIFLFGNRSIEIWENNGIDPFKRVPGGYLDIGCIASHSVVPTDKGLYFLDHQGRFRLLSNGEARLVSSPMDNDIKDYASIKDCIGFQVYINGRPFIIWQFLGAQKTLLFDYDPPENTELNGPNWAEWSFWNSENASRESWLGSCACYVPEWGLQVVGSWKSPSLYLMSENYQTDRLSFSELTGHDIRFQHVTGHIDHGIPFKKRCRKLWLRLRRGYEKTELFNGYGNYYDNSEFPPRMMVRWNDDNKGWSAEHYIDLGGMGDREIMYALRARGIYRTRQYEITVTDPVQVTIGGAKEDLDVLTS